MPNNANVKVLGAAAEFETIREVWQSWAGNRDSEMDSYLKFIESNQSTIRPHVVVVERDGRPDAIFVGRVDQGHISARIGYFGLKLPARILYFVYGAFRGSSSSDNCEIIIKSVMESLSTGEADVAYVNFLKEDSDLLRLALTKPKLMCRDYVRTSQRHFAADLPNSVDEFYRGLSSNARWQAKSKQKKLLKEFNGDVKIRCYREATELNTLIEDVEQVAKTSYQRGLGVGFADSPEMRERLRFRAERGWLQAYVLYVAGRPCAFWIGDMNAGAFGSDYLAYDGNYAKYSPGMYLIFKVIEGFCDNREEGVKRVDFATGHAQYKEVLSNQMWTETSAYIFAPTAKGMFLNIFRSIVGRVDKGIKNVLARTNLLTKVKKAWREHAKPKEAVQAGV